MLPFHRKSYSQCGEDLILSAILKNLGILQPWYVDIGANDPVVYNNTYLFYRRGSSGILIEPNPQLAKKLRLKRSRDIVIEAGIGAQAGTLPFFVMRNNVLSTFSEDEKDRLVAMGFALDHQMEVPIMTISDVFEQTGKHPIDVLSLDTEGLDLEILTSIDYKTAVRPKIICVEPRQIGREREQEYPIHTFLRAKNYIIAAHTPVNTIFVDAAYDQVDTYTSPRS